MIVFIAFLLDKGNENGYPWIMEQRKGDDKMNEKKKTRKCPACNGSLKASRVENVDVDRCRKCGGLTSESMYLGDSYTLVLPYFHEGSYREDEVRYFDFTTLGSEGVSRRHGWYVPRTRRIVQVG